MRICFGGNLDDSVAEEGEEGGLSVTVQFLNLSAKTDAIG